MDPLDSTIQELKKLSESQIKEVADFIVYLKNSKKLGLALSEDENEFPGPDWKENRFNLGC